MEISKELLCKVFGQEIRFIKYVANNTYEVHFEKPTRLKYIIINIYELAHKCKEWALDNKLLGNSGYNLYTEHNIGINYHRSSTENNPSNKNYNYWKCFCSIHDPQRSTIGLGATEPESIFKACQWILDTKEGN